MNNYGSHIICKQNVHIDEVQENLLDQLDDTRDWHRDHWVHRHEREVVKAIPYVLDEDREAEIDRHVFTDLELTIFEGASQTSHSIWDLWR